MPNREQYWVIDRDDQYADGPYESIDEAIKETNPDNYDNSIIVQVIGKISVEIRFVPIEPE